LSRFRAIIWSLLACACVRGPTRPQTTLDNNVHNNFNGSLIMARTTRTRVPEELFPRVAMIIEKAGKTTDDFTEILRNGSAYGLPDDYQVGDQTVEAKLTRTPDGFEYDDEGTIYENVNGEKVEISVQEFKRRLQLPKDHPEFIEN